MMAWEEEGHPLLIVQHLALLMVEEVAGQLQKTPMIQRRSVDAANFSQKNMIALILFKHLKDLEVEFNLLIQQVLN
jgi:hypothetical protein